MGYLVIANLFLLLFLGVADNQMIAALLPALVVSFKVSVKVAGLLVVTYSVAAAVASFVSGSLSDHYGRRRFLLIGVLLFSLAFAGDWFDYAVRGRAIGLISSAYFVAPILGVPLAGQIADHWGWRRVFVFFAVLALAVACASLALPKSGVPKPAPARLQTSLLSVRTFLAKRDLVAALGIAFLVSGGLVGFITYIGQWLHDRFGIATGGITMIFMVGGLASLIGAPLGGILSDRWGKRVVSIASNALLALAVAIVPLLPWGATLVLAFGITGLGAAFRQGPLTALMTEMVPGVQRGSFIALRNISSQLGIGTVALTGGILYEHYGYAAVTTLCALMTALVAVLLSTHIVEPQPTAEIAHP